MPMAAPPSPSTASTEGNFIPSFLNPGQALPCISTEHVEQSVRPHFIEDEAVGPAISDAYAKYVEDCCGRRILSTELTKFKVVFKQPSNCSALNVLTINPTLWAQLPRDYKGLTGVVTIKETLLQFNSHPDQLFSLFKTLNEQLDTCVALLGNAFLESSYRRRDLVKPAINSRFHSLCGSKTPVTNFLFGDNMLETAKTIQSSHKMTRSLAPSRPNYAESRPPNRFSSGGSRQHSTTTNHRG